MQKEGFGTSSADMVGEYAQRLMKVKAAGRIPKCGAASRFLRLVWSIKKSYTLTKGSKPGKEQKAHGLEV